MRSEIILIGSMGVGKSTQGKLLSQRLGLPQCLMDDLHWSYYQEIGYEQDFGAQLREREGFLGLYRYWKPFEAYVVERLLSEHSICVIDFGAGHLVYEDDALFARRQRLLIPYRNVVLLLPSPDLDESVQILKERNRRSISDQFDFCKHFVKHHSNHDLAKFVVYTLGKTPEETYNEILCLTASARTGELQGQDID